VQLAQVRHAGIQLQAFLRPVAVHQVALGGGVAISGAPVHGHMISVRLSEFCLKVKALMSLKPKTETTP
ncbi:MAG: hypothetical protein IJB25_06040, partial [Clostridia bacterium]|nr:hypothetical protein [Clostridia bacterium]